MRMKHVELRHLFLREKVQEREVQSVRRKTDDMIADKFTRALNLERFTKLQRALNMKEDPF